MNSMTWVLDADAFPNGDCLAEAAKAAGHRVVRWNDDWLTTKAWPEVEAPCVFHGSLGSADQIRKDHRWRPGAFCNTPAFHCSTWYQQAKPFLMHERWEVLSATRLVDTADAVLSRFGGCDSIFVRPDSPLKPFSGRVVTRGKLTLAALDHGFYYEDAELPVVVAPVREILREWRYVVVRRKVVAGSAYTADGRTAKHADAGGAPWEYAQRIALALPPPDPVYVLDVCDTPEGLRLLEIGPFSGADLYACDGSSIVQHVSALLLGSDDDLTSA